MSDVERWLEGLPAAHQSVLRDMYSATQLEGEDGTLHAIDEATRLSAVEGASLYHAALQTEATRTLEIGMAFGFSTLWLMAALPTDGRHTAIDPFQRSDWHGIGLRQAARADPLERLRLLEAKSAYALPRLIEAGETFDLIFIDGAHRFDDVLVDFYFADQLCRTRGLVVFDDMWMPSVQRAAAFVVKNRAYRHVRAPTRNALFLRKLENDNRPWDHFVEFGRKPGRADAG